MDSLLTAEQVAGILNCKVSTVYSWAEQGKVPCLKINGLLRFVPSEIALWLESFREEKEGVIQTGKRSYSDVSIENIIKKAVADTKKNKYNISCMGKPDQSSPERRD